jgi:hypothetical protein
VPCASGSCLLGRLGLGKSIEEEGVSSHRADAARARTSRLRRSAGGSGCGVRSDERDWDYYDNGRNSVRQPLGIVAAGTPAIRTASRNYRVWAGMAVVGLLLPLTAGGFFIRRWRREASPSNETSN